MMSDLEDDLVSYGTPLEPVEEDDIPNKKPRLLEDQVVKDKQGRRRFHGAFTGGFSAGFFNTVGSLEGWFPTSFKSSKSKKQEISLQKPQDFMDEEDLSEFGIAPVVLKAKQDYTVESKKKFPAVYKFSTLGNYVLHDLLKPVRETVGIKLLRKMGWKPGQGVGPRLNKKEKENIFKMRQKTYGCQLPPGSLEEKEEIDTDSNSDWEHIEFAPSDCEPILYEARNDSCGLGYEGLDKRPVLSGNFLRRGEKAEEESKQFGFSSQAFGVGAFEEEDEDIYAKDDMSRYDVILGSDPSGEENKLVDKLSFGVDGILEGFVLETKKCHKKHYPLPKLPKDYKSRPKIRHSRFDHLLLCEKVKKDSKVNLEDRRKLFEDHREEIWDGRKQAKDLISNVKINKNEFKPFISNPEKQRRYENYLKLMNVGKKELLSHIQPLSMAQWDKQKEAEEFEKAALLFKPLAGEMGDRFLTAKQPDDLCDPLAAVEKYVDENDDRIKAAKVNMFGPLTRRTEDWIPSPLLCKRFNVPESNKSKIRNMKEKTEKCSYNLFDVVRSQEKNKQNTEESENVEYSLRQKLDEDDLEINNLRDGNMKEEQDLFKAIFLASDDEDRHEDKEKYLEVTGMSGQSKTELSLKYDSGYDDKLINWKRNLSPPSGIFENIDLELLSSNKKIAGEPHKAGECQAENVQTNSSPLNLVYGPELPEKVKVKVRIYSTEPVQEDAVWVEKKLHGGKKRKKKNKKNKKTLHKSKYKHKKHKR